MQALYCFPRPFPVTDSALLPLPDRLAIDPRSPHHVAAVFQHDVGIRFNGKDRLDVVEYCISEGWVRVPVGKSKDRRGNPMTMKIKGTVEAWFLDTADGTGTAAD